MAIRDIVLLGDPVLRERAAEVTEFDDELRRLVEDMYETMYHASGVGLAAPQIGISKRIFVIDVRDEEDEVGGRYALINPEIVEVSPETEKAPEGCLSIPGLEEIVERPWRVVLRARDPHGNDVEIDGDDLLARAMQHELDHLNGVLFLDHLSPLKRKLALKKWQRVRPDAE